MMAALLFLAFSIQPLNGDDDFRDCPTALYHELEKREECLRVGICKSANECLLLAFGPLKYQEQYRCIEQLCNRGSNQIPETKTDTKPFECPLGHVAIGPNECLPFAVTGGECTEPEQCLGSSSICIRQKCRGPCQKNQVLVDGLCVDYEGGGCIDQPCVQNKCPHAFPSCNYVPQKGEYICCERQIHPTTTGHCPDPNSVAQINVLTNDVVNCLVQPCAPGFSCQFSASITTSNFGDGAYICCAIPSQPPQQGNYSAGNGKGQKQQGQKGHREWRKKLRMKSSRSRTLYTNIFDLA